MGVILGEDGLLYDDSIPLSLFYHVISGPNSRYEKKYSERVNFPELDVRGRTSSIARTGEIQGRPKGLFVQAQEKWPSLECVSLTLANLRTLKRSFCERASSSGICFIHSSLEQRQVKKVIHINQGEQFPPYNSQTAYLFDIVSPGLYDFRWENEWRVKGNLPVTSQNVAFVLTEESDFGGFSLDLSLVPIHHILSEPYILIPKDYDGLIDLTFDVPFLSSLLITNPQRFFEKFLEENYLDYLFQPLIEGLINDYGGHISSIDKLHEQLLSISFSINRTEDWSDFQEAFLEYAYLSKFTSDAYWSMFGDVVVEEEVNLDWFRTKVRLLRDSLINTSLHILRPEIESMLGY